MMDGGIILKWKRVEAGQSLAQAEQTVHEASLGLGGALLGLGALLSLCRKYRLSSGLLVAVGAAAVAAGVGWLR